MREDEDGYLFFEGRDDDIIVTAGYRVGPFEVESALVSHPAVAEAAAVAAPDEERGSVVRAIVVLRDGELTVDFNERLQNVGGSCAAQAIRESVTQTLARLPSVKRVVITAAGSKELALQP